MMFYLSKMLWFFFNPFNLIIIFILIGIIFKLINFKFLSRIFYLFSFFLFFLSAILPTGSYLIYLLEKDFHNSLIIPENLDGILILSGATNPYLTKEFNQVALGGSAERLTESILIIQKIPNAKIIFSGGPAHIEYPNLKDSDSAKKFYNEMGVDISKIIFEEKSKNTYENILFSKNIAQPKKNENWLVITSAFHLKRVLNVSDKLKWNLIPYATDFKHSKKFNFKLSIHFLSNLLKFQQVSHEWIALIYYYLTGKSDKIF